MYTWNLVTSNARYVRFYRASRWIVRIGDCPEIYGFHPNKGSRWRIFSYGETVLWLKTIDFWAIPSPFKIKILISIWSQRTENQKFDRKENVMSEQVKMPVRHFLRSDYLHIFFSIKFLVFVSLVPQISIFLKILL